MCTKLDKIHSLWWQPLTSTFSKYGNFSRKTSKHWVQNCGRCVENDDCFLSDLIIDKLDASSADACVNSWTVYRTCSPISHRWTQFKELTFFNLPISTYKSRFNFQQLETLECYGLSIIIFSNNNNNS